MGVQIFGYSAVNGDPVRFSVASCNAGGLKRSVNTITWNSAGPSAVGESRADIGHMT